MGEEVISGHAIAAFVIGVIELLMAVIIVICSLVLHFKVSISFFLTPYWAAIPYLVTGTLGALLLFKRNLCLMIAFLVCNIITFIVQGIGFIIIAIAVSIYAIYADGGCTYSYNSLINEKTCRCKTPAGDSWNFKATEENCNLIKDVSTLLYVITVFLALASFVSLAGAILGCIGTCCRNRSQPGAIILKQDPQQGNLGMYNPPMQPTSQPPPYYTNNTEMK